MRAGRTGTATDLSSTEKMFAQIEISQRLAAVFKTRQRVPTVRERGKRVATLFQTGQDNMVSIDRAGQFVACIEEK